MAAINASLRNDADDPGRVDVTSTDRRSRRKAANEDLAIVEEEDYETTNEKAQADEASPSEDDGNAEDSASDVLSAGSSVHTSHSITQIRDLDRKAIVDALPDLYQDSATILAFFDHQDAAKLKRLHNELITYTSRTAKRLAGLLALFESSREPFGQGRHIKPDHIARKLAGDEVSSIAANINARPDAIFRMANLAHLIAIMFLEFPHPFTSGWGGEDSEEGMFSSVLDEETVELALDLRTQFLIVNLQTRHREPNFDPDLVSKLVFYNETGLRSIGDLEDQTELPQTYQPAFVRRAQDISKYFLTQSEDPVDFEGLEREFPWSDFLVRLAGWAQLRTKELQTQIDKQGGVEEIQRQLKDGDTERVLTDEPGLIEVPGKNASNDIDHQPPATKMPMRQSSRKPTPPKNTVPGPEHLKERLSHIRKRKSAATVLQGSEIPAEPELPPSAQMAGDSSQALQEVEFPIPAVADEIKVGSSPHRSQNIIVASQQTVVLQETLARQAAQSDKENSIPRRRYIDPQPGAHRVKFDDSQDEQQPGTIVPSASIHSPGKRTHIETEDESDFETDQRPNKTPRRTQRTEQTQRSPEDDRISYQGALDRQLTSPQRPPSRHLRSPLQPRQITHLSPRSDSQPQARPPLQPGPRLPQSTSPPPTSQSTQVNREAKARAQRLRSEKEAAQQRTSQTRRPYSEEEVERLIELIEEHGTSWAKLKVYDSEHPNGPRLDDRTQVNLKDKARNLKMDYLKAGAAMPENFTEIKLGNRLIGMLDDLRVPHYEDMEH